MTIAVDNIQSGKQFSSMGCKPTFQITLHHPTHSGGHYKGAFVVCKGSVWLKIQVVPDDFCRQVPAPRSTADAYTLTRGTAHLCYRLRACGTSSHPAHT